MCIRDRASTDYGAQTETEQDIISESATTEITGYQPTMSVSQQCTKGDEVFEYVNQKRRSRATLGSSHSWLLNIDMWDSTGESSDITYKAEVQEAVSYTHLHPYHGVMKEALNGVLTANRGEV